MMPARRTLPALLLILLAIIACQPQPQAIIPTIAVLPTSTPTATATPLPPTARPTETATPSPTPSCSALIASATTTLRIACAGMGEGEACYGGIGASVEAVPGQPAPTFNVTGDRAPLSSIRRVDAPGYDPARGIWAMARLRVRAEPPAQVVTLLAFGGASVTDAGTGTGAFQAMNISTGPTRGLCESGPLPGVLLQNETNFDAALDLNGLTLTLGQDATVLVHAVNDQRLTIFTLQGSASALLPGGQEPLTAPAGTQIEAPLSGARVTGFAELAPLDNSLTGLLPLSSLPGPASVSAPLQITAVDVAQTAAAFAPSATPLPTTTPLVPFAGTPPDGVYLTYRTGTRIEPGAEIFTRLEPGTQDIYIFRPVGFAPESFDVFQVEAEEGSGFDPVLTVESATWGPYATDYNASVGTVEFYAESLAGSGGEWRIIVRDLNNQGGWYTLTYRCNGACGTPTVEPEFPPTARPTQTPRISPTGDSAATQLPPPEQPAPAVTEEAAS